MFKLTLLWFVFYSFIPHSQGKAQDYTYDVHETSVTTDISCWMGNTKISPKCSLERCDYWITYNSTFSPKGMACISSEYTVDGQKYVYRNCVNTVSSRYDPCEKIILGAENIRMDVLSCEICFDNGCNYIKNGPLSSNLVWYLLALLLISLVAFFLVYTCQHLAKCYYQC